MSSPFAAPALPTPSNQNPFVTKSKPGGGNPFTADGAKNSTFAKRPNSRGHPAGDGDHEPKRKGRGFRDKDAGLSDGDKSRPKHRDDRKNGNKKHLPNGTSTTLKKPPLNKRRARENGTGNATDTSRPTSSSSASSVNDSTAPPNGFGYFPSSPDPHARRVYAQLRKDGIAPPNWPSQPGDPTNKGTMAKFRESYEKYRTRVRASLTKAGLIDDPSKRRTLNDAIDFRGICEDMCPEFEKITRITEFDVYQPEKDPQSNIAQTRLMVKKLARSAAGQEAPLPMDVRSVPTLKATLNYLIDDLLCHDGNLPVLHGFLWDRTRAIRRDFTFFSSLTPEELKNQVYVLENIARFHVTSLHLLSQSGKTPEDFVPQQELEQLGKSLLSLRDLYDDCNDQGIVCENEAEFRAYYLVFHAQDPNIIEVLQRQWKPHLWKNSDEVRTAVSLVEAMQNTRDFHGPLRPAPSLAAAGPLHSYFRIVEDPSISYTMACFAECHFATLRHSLLTALVRALARPKEETKDVTAAALNEFLRFDTVDEAIAFAERRGLEFEPDDEFPLDSGRRRLILRPRQILLHVRLDHQASQNIVEKKRGGKSLPDVIHSTVFDNANAPQQASNETAKSSLFMPDSQAATGQGSAFRDQPVKPINPFAGAATSVGQASNNSAFSFAATTAGNAQPTPSLQPSAGQASFSTFPQQGQTQPIANPFAASRSDETEPPPSAFPFTSSLGGASTTQTTKVNPFASKTSKTTADAPSPDGASPPPISSFLGAGFAVPSPTTSTTVPAEKKSPSFAFPPATATSLLTSPAPQGAPATSGPTFGLPNSTPNTSQGNSSQSPAVTSQQTTQKPLPTVDQTPASSFFSQPAVKDQASTPLAPSFGIGSNATGTTTPALGSLQPKATLAPAAPMPEPAPAAPGSAPISAPILPPAPPAPPRDVMKDFNKWFTLGDNGLLEEFTVYMIEDLLRPLYDTFVVEQEEKARKEEEEAAQAEAERWRVYNLRLKFFYRWKRNAREKRQRFLRRSGRDQMREFYAAQRRAEQEKKDESARKAAEQVALLADINRPAELRDLVKRRKISARQAEDALLASGVLSGVANEREAIAKIVHHDRGSPTPSSTVDDWKARSISKPNPKEGSKTRALREELLGRSALRQSLPPMPSKRSASPSPAKSKSRVSERWRLKAMGFVQMPDGSVLPESMADEIIYGGKRYPGIWSSTNRSSSQGPSALRASLGNTTSSPRARASSYSTPPWSTPLNRSTGVEGRTSRFDRTNAQESSPTKRKRSLDEESAPEVDGHGGAHPHKRTVSDLLDMASKVRSQHQEIKAMLEDMLGEDTEYFRAESERLQSEARSRSRDITPRRDGIKTGVPRS